MKAIQAVTLGKPQVVEIPEPELEKENTILVRTRYLGCNPCDVLCSSMPQYYDSAQILGCDYSGIVEKIGANVRTDLKLGDRVAGPLAGGVGGDLTRGAFADLVPAYDDYCFPVPVNISDAEAATLGVAISTIAVSFHADFAIPIPEDDPTFGKGKPFLIHGGSTVTGLWAIQFAALSGFSPIIATCSPHNFDLVKSRGADEVFDYHDIGVCAESIKARVGSSLKYAYVCVYGEDGPRLCEQVLSPPEAKFVTIAGAPPDWPGVKSAMSYGQSVMAETYKTSTGPDFRITLATRTSERKELGLRVWKYALRLLEEGKLKPPPIDLRENGLEGALEGIQDLAMGKISGKKIVTRM